MDRTYLCIDLKSFYASVECVTRGLDPLTTNLVVADVGRTEKTICLAVTPSLKAYGIPGRARLFEVIQKVEQINRQRKYRVINSIANRITPPCSQEIPPWLSVISQHRREWLTIWNTALGSIISISNTLLPRISMCIP